MSQSKEKQKQGGIFSKFTTKFGKKQDNIIMVKYNVDDPYY